MESENVVVSVKKYGGSTAGYFTIHKEEVIPNIFNIKATIENLEKELPGDEWIHVDGIPKNQLNTYNKIKEQIQEWIKIGGFDTIARANKWQRILRQIENMEQI